MFGCFEVVVLGVSAGCVVFCPGAGACFFSFRGFRLVTSAPCGGGFFAGFASGFRWCLAVLSAWPGGCCSGRVRARFPPPNGPTEGSAACAVALKYYLHLFTTNVPMTLPSRVLVLQGCKLHHPPFCSESFSTPEVTDCMKIMNRELE